ncbi:hypothetical protein Dimus_014385 [Dionaea muscipula]
MPSAVAVVRTVSKRLLKLGLTVFPSGFSSSKCKTWVKMTTARIKLLRNKREAVLKQMRRDVALLLQSGQDATARIRVEHVIREQNAMAANEIIELFCDQIVTRLSIIGKQRECPADLKEGIGSLIFAAQRCSDIPELLSIRDIFEKKYGKDFVSAATDLRPDSGVNRLLIEKLSSRNPTGELKLKVLKEIAKEYQIDWDTTETEMELLKPPEERIEGPRTFVSATSLPLKQPTPSPTPTPRSSGGAGTGNMHFEDAASAAKAAAESANIAVAAAQAAAQLAGTKPYIALDKNYSGLSNISFGTGYMSNPSKFGPGGAVDEVGKGDRFRESWSFGGSQSTSNESGNVVDCRKVVDRRHSYNAPSACSRVQFDDSDCDEEVETELTCNGMKHQPPSRDPPPLPTSDTKQEHVPRVHPKLPDYDALAARFEALKYSKSHR